MALIRESWLPRAEALEEGKSRRVDHDCGGGRTLKIWRDHEGLHGYCHRCGDGGRFVPTESLADKLARIGRLSAGDDVVRGLGVGELPMPQVREVSEWPVGAAVWLYKAGLGRQEIGRLGIYYHRASDRVVLPCGAGYFQARAYQRGRMPKYMGPSIRPGNLVPVWGRAHHPTLTEDILSAMKVGEVAEGWCVLGTHVSDAMVAALLKRGTFVNVWLDPDAAGRKGAAKIIKQLRAYGLTVRDIVSERDPKLHTRSEIQSILENHEP